MFNFIKGLLFFVFMACGACLSAYFIANNFTFASSRLEHNDYSRPIIKYKKPVKLEISSNGINRISFNSQIVTNIWGDSSLYSAKLSSNGSELFFTPKIDPGEDMFLSIGLAGGEVIDLVLKVKDLIQPKIISIDLSGDTREDRDVKLEAMSMIKAMQSGDYGKYFVKNIDGKNQYQFIESKDGFTFRLKSTYQFENIKGYKFIVQNNGRCTRNVNSKILSGYFSDVVAILSESFLLPAGDEMMFFIITKQEQG